MGFKYQYDAFAVLLGGYLPALFQVGPYKMTTLGIDQIRRSRFKIAICLIGIWRRRRRVNEGRSNWGSSPTTFTVKNKLDQFTTLLAQLLLAKASGLALKAKPIPSI